MSIQSRAFYVGKMCVGNSHRRVVQRMCMLYVSMAAGKKLLQQMALQRIENLLVLLQDQTPGSIACVPAYHR